MSLSGRRTSPLQLTLTPAQIDWQPDTLTWLIDGNIVRTLKKSDTVNPAGVALYPTTPARIQIRYNPLLILSLDRTDVRAPAPAYGPPVPQHLPKVLFNGPEA